MIQVKTKPDLLPKPGAPRQEEMSTIPVKNTLLLLNGQNVALAAKNSVHSRAPGPHLSPVPGKAAGRLTASPQLTQEGTAQLDLLLQKSPKLVLNTAKNHPARRPLKLAPLVLFQDVQQQSQKPKLRCNHDDAKLKAKTCVHREKISSIKLKKPSKPLVKGMDDVVCQGTPAPLFPKLFPKASTGPNLTNQDNAGKRRLRLTRGQCLEEDETKFKVSTTTLALCSDKDKRVKGVRSKGQLQVTAQRGNLQSGKSITVLPVVPQENKSVKKSGGEDRKPRSVTCALKSPGNGPAEPGGVKASPATSWGLKRKKALLTKHNKAVTLERLQL